jgi:8-oxo-dGTP diphosphatase
MAERIVRVGVGVLITDKDKVLLGLRKGKRGADTWSLPGGHLEHGESLSDCAARETLEETGLRVKPELVVSVSNDIFDEHHYVTVGVKASIISGTVTNKEPLKCARWEWFEMNDLPKPLFLATENLLALYNNNMMVRPL